MLGEVQRSSSRPPWKVRAYCRTGQYQRGEVYHCKFQGVNLTPVVLF